MKTFVLLGSLIIASQALAQGRAGDASADESGDKAAAAAEHIMGINNPPTGIEQLRDDARNAGSRAGGGAEDWRDNYKPRTPPMSTPKNNGPAPDVTVPKKH